MPPPASLERTIVLLAGFPGVGKLSVARALVNGSPNARAVDNHLYLNPVLSVTPEDGAAPLPLAVWSYVETVRGAVVAAIRHLTPLDWGFVFTDDLLEGDARSLAVFAGVQALAEVRQAVFVPVRLVCDAETLAKRVVSAGRAGQHKEIDPDESRKRCTRCKVLDTGHPATLTLDTTRLSADQTAAVILRHVARLKEARANGTAPL